MYRIDMLGITYKDIYYLNKLYPKYKEYLFIRFNDATYITNIGLIKHLTHISKSKYVIRLKRIKQKIMNKKDLLSSTEVEKATGISKQGLYEYRSQPLRRAPELTLIEGVDYIQEKTVILYSPTALDKLKKRQARKPARKDKASYIRKELRTNA